MPDHTRKRPPPGFNAPDPALLVKPAPEITIESPVLLAVTVLPALRVTPPPPPARSVMVPALSAPLTARFPLPSVVTVLPAVVE